MQIDIPMALLSRCVTYGDRRNITAFFGWLEESLLYWFGGTNVKFLEASILRDARDRSAS
jgi:hypothetical protein